MGYPGPGPTVARKLSTEEQWRKRNHGLITKCRQSSCRHDAGPRRMLRSARCCKSQAGLILAVGHDRCHQLKLGSYQNRVMRSRDQLLRPACLTPR